ncbi:hypothetical protein C8F01DRAFT_1320891 [Mycena amicta]|nr:hypothetical protein C8F01DRAFT_1287313 [Mycena amicta]KAJ7055263.1 hypothetical protein C8F01DRAFT_1320891 [Mycena amicta]
MALRRSRYLHDADIIDGHSANIPFLLEFMKDWSDEKMWLVATYGKLQWHAVRRRLLKSQSDHQDAIAAALRLKQAGARPGSTQTAVLFPLEIWGEITKHSDLFTIAALATTCLWLHKIVNEDLDRCMTKAFEMVGLDWIAVRFILRGTHGLLAGDAALCMLYPGCGYWTFETLGTMDFMVNRTQASLLLTFMKNALGWDSVPAGTLRRVPVITQNYWLRELSPKHHQHPMTMAIRICDLDPPRLRVFRSALTSDFGHFDGTRLVVPYASSTLSGVAIPNIAFESLALDIGPSLGLASEARANRYAIRVRQVIQEYRRSPSTFNMHSTGGPETFTFVYRNPITRAAHREHPTPVWCRLHLPSSVLPTADADKAAPFLVLKEDDELDNHAGPHAAVLDRMLRAPAS